MCPAGFEGQMWKIVNTIFLWYWTFVLSGARKNVLILVMVWTAKTHVNAEMRGFVIILLVLVGVQLVLWCYFWKNRTWIFSRSLTYIFQGRICDQPCSFGTYGEACLMKCSCKNGAECNPVTGGCKCLPGFTGPDCGRTCPTGSFGQDCQSICDCKNDAWCDPLTGACACKDNYYGSKCESSCKLITFHLKI